MYEFNVENMKRYWKILFARMYSNELLKISAMLNDCSISRSHIQNYIDKNIINLLKKLDLSAKDIYQWKN